MTRDPVDPEPRAKQAPVHTQGSGAWRLAGASQPRQTFVGGGGGSDILGTDKAGEALADRPGHRGPRSLAPCPGYRPSLLGRSRRFSRTPQGACTPPPALPSRTLPGGHGLGGVVRAGPLAAVWAEAQRLSRLGGEQGRPRTQSPQAAPCCHAGSQTGISCRRPVTARCWPAGASVPPGWAVGQAAWATGPLHGPWCTFLFFFSLCAFQTLPLCLQTPRAQPSS